MASKVKQTVVNFGELISIDELMQSITQLYSNNLIDIVPIYYKYNLSRHLICSDDVHLLNCNVRELAQRMLEKTFVLETHTGGKQSSGIMTGGVIDTSFDNIAKYLVDTKNVPLISELPNVIFGRDECKLAQCFYRDYYKYVDSSVVNGQYEILYSCAQDIVSVASKIYNLIDHKISINNFRTVKKGNLYDAVYLHPHHLIVIDLLDHLNAFRLLMDRIICLHNVHKNHSLSK